VEGGDHDIFMVVSCCMPGVTEKNLNQDGKFPGGGLNPGPPEQKWAY
jgi:hypothetical protein